MVKDNLITLPGMSAVPATAPPLPEKDAELCLKIVADYRNRRKSLRHLDKSISRDLSVIDDYLNFVGKPFWLCSEEDFERWSSDIFETRRLAMSTQRHYQGVIRDFYDYIVTNQSHPETIRQRYGVRVRQICNEENCVPHVLEREINKERTAFTHEEVDQFFDALERAMREARTFASKDLYPLMRDKAMFFLLYVGGFRISEVIGMDTGSFKPEPRVPEMRGYGLACVWRKGSKGSGKKYQEVPLIHADLPDMMEWYLQRVRPKFLMCTDANEPALFLSERGRRIGISTLEARFQHAIVLAGLEGRNFTPHCLRHSSVTHDQLRLSLEAVRIKHGHKYAATTQLYTHIPDKYVAEEIVGAINYMLDQADERKDKN